MYRFHIVYFSRKTNTYRETAHHEGGEREAEYFLTIFEKLLNGKLNANEFVWVLCTSCVRWSDITESDI